MCYVTCCGLNLLFYLSQDGSKTQTKEEEAGLDNDGDESMGGGEEEEETGNSKSEASRQNRKLYGEEEEEASRQNRKLYAAESMLNTKKQKAEKNKRKKLKKAAGGGEDAMDGDYDFKIDYSKKNEATAMDEGDGFQIDAKIPMAALLDLPQDE